MVVTAAVVVIAMDSVVVITDVVIAVVATVVVAVGEGGLVEFASTTIFANSLSGLTSATVLPALSLTTAEEEPLSSVDDSGAVSIGSVSGCATLAPSDDAGSALLSPSSFPSSMTSREGSSSDTGEETISKATLDVLRNSGDIGLLRSVTTSVLLSSA